MKGKGKGQQDHMLDLHRKKKHIKTYSLVFVTYQTNCSKCRYPSLEFVHPVM